MLKTDLLVQDIISSAPLWPPKGLNKNLESGKTSSMADGRINGSSDAHIQAQMPRILYVREKAATHTTFCYAGYPVLVLIKWISGQFFAIESFLSKWFCDVSIIYTQLLGYGRIICASQYHQISLLYISIWTYSCENKFKILKSFIWNFIWIEIECCWYFKLL